MPLGVDRVHNENPRDLSALARLAVFAVSATPLVLVPHFFFPFVTTRNVFFRLSVELALAAVLFAGVRRLRDVDTKRDDILRWFAVYLGVLAITAVAGVAPWHSVFGDFERMGGVFAWLHLLLFYCLLRIVMRERDWVVLFRLIVIAADVVVLFGAMQFLPASVRNPLFQTTLEAGSTIGNQGLLGPYLLLASAFALWDIFRGGSRVWRLASSASLLILLFGMVGSRNRSSELGLLVGAAVASCVFLYHSTQRRRVALKLLAAAGGAAAALGAAALIVTSRAPRVAELVVGRWKFFLASPIDHARTIEWKIALEGFRDRPLFGYGPENHQVVASHHFDPRIYSVLSEGVFDRAHNAWLELLATSGILGAFAMAGIWIASVVTIRRGVRNGALSAGEAALISGTLAAYATYLTFWFFDINSVILWVVLLAYLSSRVNGVLEVSAIDHSRRAHPFAWATIGVTLLAAYFHGIIPLKAAHELSTAASGGTFDERLVAFEAVLNSSAPQTMHTFPLYYRFLRSAEPQLSSFSTAPLLRKEFDLAMQRGFIEADRSIARNSADDRSYVDAARLFTLAGAHYSDIRYVQRAKAALSKAVRISPRRPDARVLLSGIYLTLGDTTTGAAQLDSAMALAPDFLPTFVYASRLELARGNPDSSAALLTRAINGRRLPIEGVLRSVMDSLRGRHEDGRAAEIGSRYLESIFGPERGWAKSSASNGVTAFELELAAKIPILYLNAGNDLRALQSAASLAVLQPGARTTAAQFSADVRLGQGAKWKSRASLVSASSTAAATVTVR